MILFKHDPTMNISTTHFMNLLKISAKTSNIHLGKSIQANLFKLGHQNVLSLQNQLLNVYVKCNELRYTLKLFDEISVRNFVTWNTLLCGFAHSGPRFESILEDGFSYFKKMLVEKIGLDRVAFTSLFRISTEIDDVFIGRQLHCFVVKLGLCVDCSINSALIDFYSKFGFVRDARVVFDCCLEKDLVLWNGMMSCYAFNRLAKEAFSLFGLMRSESVEGDVFTFSNILKSSVLGYFDLGKQIHSLTIRFSLDADVVVASTLIDMYANNEEIMNARKIFDSLVYKNTISWNTIIVGYGLYDQGHEAMKLTKEMFRENIYPDEVTLSNVLSSCGNSSSSSFSEITQIHCYAMKNDFQSFVSVANSLINAYSKFGNIDLCFQCFSCIAIPNLVSYSSMIRAYGYHGLPRKSIQFFEKMIGNNIRPDQVSFLGVLSACSHGGLISEGIYYFDLMTRCYKITPSSEHYTCVIDLLGRAGLLNEAFTVLTSCKSMPDALGAFIGACKVHGNSKLAKWAVNQILLLEPNESVNYSVLSNLYAYDGRWANVARVRNIMREKCDYKGPGCSWIEIRGDIFTFVSSDKSHAKLLEIYSLLNVLGRLSAEEDCLAKVDVERI